MLPWGCTQEPVLHTQLPLQSLQVDLRFPFSGNKGCWWGWRLHRSALFPTNTASVSVSYL